MKEILKRLRAEFKDEVKFFGFTSREPQLNFVEREESLDRDKIQYYRDKLQKEGRPNELHGVLKGDIIWEERVKLNLEIYDCAEILYLREINRGFVPILSATSLLISSEAEEIILHRRSPDVSTYPNHLHTIGGGYLPNPNGDKTLKDTAVREIFEETNIKVEIDRDINVLVSQELSTGFIQFVYLGVDIPKRELEGISHSLEGEIERYKFKNIPALLDEPSWIPSGKSHLKAWLLNRIVTN